MKVNNSEIDRRMQTERCNALFHQRKLHDKVGRNFLGDYYKRFQKTVHLRLNPAQILFRLHCFVSKFPEVLLFRYKSCEIVTVFVDVFCKSEWPLLTSKCSRHVSVSYDVKCTLM